MARSDFELLEDLLVRENRLLSAYEAALRRDAIAAPLGEMLRDHEREHVRGLEQALAGGARNPRASVPPPELTAALRSREAFSSRMPLPTERAVSGSFCGPSTTRAITRITMSSSGPGAEMKPIRHSG